MRGRVCDGALPVIEDSEFSRSDDLSACHNVVVMTSVPLRLFGSPLFLSAGDVCSETIQSCAVCVSQVKYQPSQHFRTWLD